MRDYPRNVGAGANRDEKAYFHGQIIMVIICTVSVEKCVALWTNDMFRMQSHDINQPIRVWCKICDIVVGGVVIVIVGVVVVGTTFV